jgi:hypothetical protein
LQIMREKILAMIAAEERGEPLPETDEFLRLMPALPRWHPNPGPQQLAFNSPADELLYGGAAGGGKSSLLAALAAIGPHRQILLLRRERTQVPSLLDEVSSILGHREGLNSSSFVWRLPDRTIEFGGAPAVEDALRFAGRPHDLIGLDEGAQFTERQFLTFLAWNRSTVPGQRCRVVVGTNPPMSADGLWLVRRFRSWLDETHPNPAKPGELRWFTVADDGRETEHGQPVPGARSRTFVPAKLTDNPYLSRTSYADVLASLDSQLRRALRDGVWALEAGDDYLRVIPAAWVRAAQARWNSTNAERLPQSCIAVDPARGGLDRTSAAVRYGMWHIGPLHSWPGHETPDGGTVAALALGLARRGDCPAFVVDVVGVGASAYDSLASYADVHPFNAAAGTSERDESSGLLAFSNERARAWWNLRELLDPDHSCPVELPRDADLLAELCAPRYKVGPRGIQIESKDELRARLGRSPDLADAVVMAFSDVRPPRAVAIPERSDRNVIQFRRRRGMA